MVDKVSKGGSALVRFNSPDTLSSFELLKDILVHEYVPAGSLFSLSNAWAEHDHDDLLRRWSLSHLNTKYKFAVDSTSAPAGRLNFCTHGSYAEAAFRLALTDAFHKSFQPKYKFAVKAVSHTSRQKRIEAMSIAFGAWAGVNSAPIDGVSYQSEVRNEW